MNNGERVIAIRNADDNSVYIFGEGIYLGKEISPLGFSNPKIKLDNGDIVWGYQCWWGPTERIKNEFIGSRNVVIVPIEDKEE